MLRGVNVGGNQGVPMAALRSLAEALSLESPRTLLQSGNLVFASEGRTPADLEQMLEAGIAGQIGVKTEVHVRSAAEWDRIVEANPFPEAAKTDPGHLLLTVFRTPPPPDAAEAIAKAYQGPERVRVAQDCAYIVYPEGIGRSKLPPALLGRHLGKGTARNWNTVLKLQTMLAEG
jgi:uncharacterized protein (DUF1697 family)